MVALGGAPVELVVAKDMSVQFLQITTGPEFVFRVYERIVLRIKDQGAISAIDMGRSCIRASMGLPLRFASPVGAQTVRNR